MDGRSLCLSHSQDALWNSGCRLQATPGIWRGIACVRIRTPPTAMVVSQRGGCSTSQEPHKTKVSENADMLGKTEPNKGILSNLSILQQSSCPASLWKTSLKSGWRTSLPNTASHTSFALQLLYSIHQLIVTRKISNSSNSASFSANSSTREECCFSRNENSAPQNTSKFVNHSLSTPSSVYSTSLYIHTTVFGPPKINSASMKSLIQNTVVSKTLTPSGALSANSHVFTSPNNFMHRPNAKKYIFHSDEANSLLSHLCTSPGWKGKEKTGKRKRGTSWTSLWIASTENTYNEFFFILCDDYRPSISTEHVATDNCLFWQVCFVLRACLGHHALPGQRQHHGNSTRSL